MNAASELIRFLDGLRARSPALFRTALLHLGLAVLFVFLAVVDPREILGVDRWIKPLKFALSIALYLGTLGWILGQLPSATRGVRMISWGAIIAMVIETAGIAGQAARGTTSHFNNATAFDGAVFSLMGLAIFGNTLLVAWTLFLFLRHPSALTAPVLAGVRLGLLLFVLASIQGGMIVSNSAHSVGAPDGGPGLPLLNWSTRVGDLRVAHFLGLHALQLLPLAGWVLARFASSAISLRAVQILALLYGTAFLATLWQALQAQPLIPIAGGS